VVKPSLSFVKWYIQHTLHLLWYWF